MLSGGLPGWPNQDVVDGTQMEICELRNTNEIAKWRLVSSGLQMKLVNNDETNDGWFEMVRINNAMSTEDYMLQNEGQTAVDGQTEIFSIEAQVAKYLECVLSTWSNYC